MSTATDETASYAEPPVAEVALGAHFRPFVNLRSVDFGVLWDRWKGEFPDVEDQMPLPPVPIEEFDALSRDAFPFVIGPVPPRVWYKSEDRDQIVQLQRDRLVVNWSKSDARPEYPRYRKLRPVFEQVLGDYCRFIDSADTALPSIAQVVVSYMNPIAVSEGNHTEQPHDVLTLWSGAHSDAFLPIEEDVQVQATYIIPGRDQPQGRLYVQLTTRPKESGHEADFMINVFARILNPSGSLEGALQALDLGHQWVVNGFTSITTDRMHVKWGKE